MPLQLRLETRPEYPKADRKGAGSSMLMSTHQEAISSSAHGNHSRGIAMPRPFIDNHCDPPLTPIVCQDAA